MWPDKAENVKNWATSCGPIHFQPLFISSSSSVCDSIIPTKLAAGRPLLRITASAAPAHRLCLSLHPTEELGHGGRDGPLCPPLRHPAHPPSTTSKVGPETGFMRFAGVDRRENSKSFTVM
jgi:hypothetical protein